MHFLLPSHPSLLVLDRFDILSFSSPTVPFWDILNALLCEPVTSISDLIDQLESISFNLRGESNTDYGFLRTFLESHWSATERFFTVVWPAAMKLALEMPMLFPSSEIECLSEENPQIVLSRRQVACLVVHQFLCSLPAQPWETDSSVDFHIWFSSEPPCARAVEAYLHALFNYFERLVGGSGGNSPSPLLACSIAEWPVTFTLRSLPDTEVCLDDFYSSKFLPLKVIQLPEASTDPSVLGLPHGACVISANKNVGFGCSGTQEETHVGSSPEACTAVLTMPTLEDTQVLIVRGAEAMISLKGYGREARLDKVLEPNYNRENTAMSIFSRRTMLFMDALELDMFDREELVPDLLPKHVEREMRKAITALSTNPSGEARYTEIFTGLWGCGAFGGDWQIKTIIQWCAAAISGVNLYFICAGDQQQAFAANLEQFALSGLECGWTVGDVLRHLLRLDPQSSDARNAFAHVKSAVSHIDSFHLS
jgi:poly(ADP-ribose) glycohydrolase